MFSLFSTKPKKYEDISAAIFQDLAQQQDIEILDVRTSEEFSSGKILGARNIDIRNPDFLTQIKKLPRDKTYLIYCRSGARSAQASEVLSELGFENVKNLSGGVIRWPFGLV